MSGIYNIKINRDKKHNILRIFFIENETIVDEKIIDEGQSRVEMVKLLKEIENDYHQP